MEETQLNKVMCIKLLIEKAITSENFSLIILIIDM